LPHLLPFGQFFVEKRTFFLHPQFSQFENVPLAKIAEILHAKVKHMANYLCKKVFAT